MKKKILFIQGGGEGAYAEDKALANFLSESLAPRFEVVYPKFPGLEEISYQPWKMQMASELDGLDSNNIIVAHSLGASALLKYLSEESNAPQISGLFLVAMPYKCTDGEWGTDEFAVDVNFAASLPQIRNIVMYHSQDDEWVPVAHLSNWSEKLPQAIVKKLDGRGHSFSNVNFIELVEDIETYAKSSA